MMTFEELASKYFKTDLPLEITPQEEESFQHSKVCWMCENPLGDGEAAVAIAREAVETAAHTTKVRDHDHLTSKYRGAAHNKCNLNCKKKSSSFFLYFSTISVVMIVILSLKNS